MQQLNWIQKKTRSSGKRHTSSCKNAESYGKTGFEYVPSWKKSDIHICFIIWDLEK